MKSYRFSSLLIFVCLFVLMLNITLPVSAIGGPKEWAKAWTGKGPVPSWWDWSEKYEKARPVRGGVMQVASADQLGLMNLNHWPIIDAVSLTYMFELAVWYDGNLKPVKYDPKLSKKLLAEAGYEKGLEIKGVMINWDFSKNTGLAVKNMLAQVGIKWDYVVVDIAAWTATMRNLEFDFAYSGWAYILDPDLMATALYHPRGGFNNGRSNNKKVIELIEAGKNEADFEKRKQIYWDLEKALYDNYEEAWLWWPNVITAYRKELVGFNLEMQQAGGTAYWMSHTRWFRNGKPE